MTNNTSQPVGKQLEALTSKWRKAKSKLQKFQAKELDLRLQIDTILATNNELTAKVTLGSENITFTRKKNYSIPKSSIVDIRTHLSETVFNDAFTTSYALKPAVYEHLSGKCKEAIKKHLVIKDAPLSVSLKEV